MAASSPALDRNTVITMPAAAAMQEIVLPQGTRWWRARARTAGDLYSYGYKYVTAAGVFVWGDEDLATDAAADATKRHLLNATTTFWSERPPRLTGAADALPNAQLKLYLAVSAGTEIEFLASSADGF
jgi:hypothetical protein